MLHMRKYMGTIAETMMPTVKCHKRVSSTSKWKRRKQLNALQYAKEIMAGINGCKPIWPCLEIIFGSGSLRCTIMYIYLVLTQAEVV